MISIPLVIFGATLLMKIMERYPIIVTIGAGLIGWVGGEMLVTDPILVGWIDANLAWIHIHLPLGLGDVSWSQIAGAALVIVIGKWLAARAEVAEVEEQKALDLAAREQEQPK